MGLTGYLEQLRRELVSLKIGPKKISTLKHGEKTIMGSKEDSWKTEEQEAPGNCLLT